MATIRKYRGKFNVQIRKKGYPFISKSFVSLTVAKKWAATTEVDMERRVHVVIPDNTTVGQLLKRYIKEVLPSHKGHQAERYRIQTLLGFLKTKRSIWAGFFGVFWNLDFLNNFSK